MQDVVAAPKGSGPLESEDVERLLDDAQPAVVTCAIEADRAHRLVGDVEAGGAVHDLIAYRRQRRGQRARLTVGCSQQVIGQALRRLGPDAGQA